MLNGLIMKVNQQDDRTERGGEGEQGEELWRDAGSGGHHGRILCRICQVAKMPSSVYTSHSTARCDSLSAWDRMELYIALRPYEGAEVGEQQGVVLCRICQAAGMLPSAYTSHGTAQCGALSAWDRRDIYVVLRGEYGQVEQNQFNDEGQESQPNSA